MSVIAVIDLGTNSMKMHVARVADGRTTVLSDLTDVSRLGEGLHERGGLTPEAMERNLQVLGRFVAQARELGATEIVAAGTMALRTASNAGDFVDRAKRDHGVDVEILPGEEEARLGYLAVLAGLGRPEGRVCVFDTGGGSTEFIYGGGERIEQRFSVNVGSRRPTEQFLRSDPVTREELASLRSHLEAELDDLAPSSDALIGMGGNVTTMGAVMLEMETYDPDRVQGAKMSRDEVDRQIDLYRSRTIEERKKIPGLMPKRADVILTGAAIVATIMKKLEARQLTISERGLRHGLLFDRYLRRG